MFSMKKFALIAAIMAAFTLLIAGTACADVVGMVNPQKVMFQHPKFEQSQKQIRDITVKKQEEAKKGIEAAKTDQEKAKIFQDKRREAAQEEVKIMKPLFEDVNLAIRTVAKAKKITVVITNEAVMFGAIDITQDVINELKRNK